MSLIMSSVDNFTVKIIYSNNPDGSISYYEDEGPQPSNVITEIFTFRKPTWADVRNMMSASATLVNDGTLKVDPWKLMDIKVKSLLVEWTLLDSAKKKLPINARNIDLLYPTLISKLNDKIEAVLSSQIN